MELTKKELIRQLAQDQVFGVKKLARIGNSFGIVVPMTWVKFNCTEIDGDYYFKLNVEGGSLILRAITNEDLENITVRPKEAT
jgi:hypothetical protein